MKARYLWLPVVIASSFLAGTLVGTGRAQTSPRKSPKYIQVDYMKVQPANEDDYVKGEKGGVETDPPGADQAGQASFLVLLRSGLSVRDGDQVQPHHREHLCQCGQLENPYADLGAMAQKAHPGTNMDEFFAHTTKARELVRTEMWELIDQAE